MLSATLPWCQNFVWWCLIFVYPQYLTGISSPFWNLEFWGGCHIAGKFMHPWIYILLLCFIRTLCFYIEYVVKKNRYVLIVKFVALLWSYCATHTQKNKNPKCALNPKRLKTTGFKAWTCAGSNLTNCLYLLPRCTNSGAFTFTSSVLLHVVVPRHRGCFPCSIRVVRTLYL